ncbi:MAG: hypothetical protein RR034_01095 [Bacteroidales bacterium]
MFDEEKNYEVPKGSCEWETLKTGDFFAEMQDFYQQYPLQDTVMEEIAEILKTSIPEKSYISISIVFGAWCGDSREYLPYFKKISDTLVEKYKVNQESTKYQYVLFGCDREKKTGIETIDHNPVNEIAFVPTFIISLITLSNDLTAEKSIYLGNIVETPEASLEKDLLNIIKKVK